MSIDRLPEDAQTIYAEALALALAQEGDRSLSHLAGTFTTKRVRGADYVYFQYSDPCGTTAAPAARSSPADLESWAESCTNSPRPRS